MSATPFAAAAWYLPAPNTVATSGTRRRRTPQRLVTKLATCFCSPTARSQSVWPWSLHFSHNCFPVSVPIGSRGWFGPTTVSFIACLTNPGCH